MAKNIIKEDDVDTSHASVTTKVLVVALLVIAAGIIGVVAQRTDAPQAEQQNDAPSGAYSRTYEGTLPCADCEGIKTTLTLQRDDLHADNGRFTIVETYIGTPDGLEGDLSIETVGRWYSRRGTSENENAAIFVLRPDETDGDKDIAFQVLNGRTIRLLDEDMEPINSTLPYELRAR